MAGVGGESCRFHPFFEFCGQDVHRGDVSGLCTVHYSWSYRAVNARREEQKERQPDPAYDKRSGRLYHTTAMIQAALLPLLSGRRMSGYSKQHAVNMQAQGTTSNNKHPRGGMEVALMHACTVQ